MRQISMLRILSITTLYIFAAISLYSYFFICINGGSIIDIVLKLLLSLVDGLLLAIVVFIFGIYIEESRVKELKKNKKLCQFNILRNLVKKTFKRHKSHWNFSNLTPSFYFDDGWINPLYDLFLQENKQWDVFIQEYKKDFNNSELIEELNKFINSMELALINAEKLDDKLKFSQISPSLAAIMQSPFSTDRVGAKENSDFVFLIYRAAWAGANPTNIMFGLPLFTNHQLDYQSIEGLSNEAERLSMDDEFKDLIDQLKLDKDHLSDSVNRIKKLTEIDNFYL